jgi:calcineurin-like phosphoesterase family protein
MKQYFTSDTHFGSERTLELSKRPFETVEEMDNTMIRNWNALIKDEDTVYHLGDFGDWEVLKQLNGNIYIICGNYDIKEITGYSFDEFYKMECDSMAFDMLCEKVEDIRNNYNNKVKIYGCSNKGLHIDDLGYVNMCHRPSDMVDDKTFTLFGHIHKLQMVRRNGLNVGVDCHNFKPIDTDTIKFYKNGIDNVFGVDVFGGLYNATKNSMIKIKKNLIENTQRINDLLKQL